MMVAPKPTHDEAHKEITGKDCQEIAEKVCQIEFELTMCKLALLVLTLIGYFN